jgi:hypothetical protein
MSKSIFKSKIFWIQVASAAAELAQIAPAGYVALAGQVATVALRPYTKDVVHIVPPRKPGA